MATDTNDDLELLLAKAHSWDLVKKKQEEVDEAHREYLAAKDKSLECKKRFDGLVQELTDMIARGGKPDPQRKLDFGEDNKGDFEVRSDTKDLGSFGVVSAEDADGDDDAKDETNPADIDADIVVLQEIGLSEDLAKLCLKSGLKSIEELGSVADGKHESIPSFSDIPGIKKKDAKELAKIVELARTVEVEAPPVEAKPARPKLSKTVVVESTVDLPEMDVAKGQRLEGHIVGGDFTGKNAEGEDVMLSSGEFVKVESELAAT